MISEENISMAIHLSVSPFLPVCINNLRRKHMISAADDAKRR